MKNPYPEAGRDVHSLLLHADEALYRAKRAGRPQIKIYEPDAGAHYS
ncbi:hypothetical protein ALP26_103924 [Pseudomonas savastanoi pv. glycinea]|uniref:GGDEF domain-containing protein n=2 Tax=Pseudomonas savastanoi pv. glycinea TaxID=318 RepID=A0A0P9VS26_PSESG|nr:hypothetical protein PsgB076_13897 [Pseudomonas savastanoi pv. glycinea str. B076]KPC22839.1 Uncharacterized protein AC497_1726 [Pseudomonas savastanoi pv. glycinea]KPX41166.1 hypothetical protein ALO37_103070 [Pseudomonas savastanoi pv. glycinea]RMM91494.1 hypothetical protein ALQ69_104173 [Pseudomonas savastanoi pv. glycinea]RMM97663.1 hypothetical protein ALQ67_103922 [Pseudomonas savastanoi pv. glycinea]